MPKHHNFDDNLPPAYSWRDLVINGKRAEELLKPTLWQRIKGFWR